MCYKGSSLLFPLIHKNIKDIPLFGQCKELAKMSLQVTVCLIYRSSTRSSLGSVSNELCLSQAASPLLVGVAAMVTESRLVKSVACSRGAASHARHNGGVRPMQSKFKDRRGVPARINTRGTWLLPGAQVPSGVPPPRGLCKEQVSEQGSPARKCSTVKWAKATA